jgi:hypothetical protein
MNRSNRLKMTSMRIIPAHMTRLSQVARAQGLTASALVRQLVAREIRRAANAQKAAA